MYDEHFEVYGVRKVWRQLRCEGVAVARCTVARLMRRMGLQGAVRGRRAKTPRAVVHRSRAAFAVRIRGTHEPLVTPSNWEPRSTPDGLGWSLPTADHR